MQPFRSSKEAKRRLQAIAEAQAGFFTAKQAQKAGFSASSHTYHVQAGNWVREGRGIYRLAAFPAGRRPELMRSYLWSINRAGRAQGVYSHSTALGLYFFPEKKLPELHMTVPLGFRRSGAMPKGVVLHYANLPKSDVDSRDGYRLTTPLRTILDLLTAKTLKRPVLSKTLLEMVERGWITRAQVKNARVPEESRRMLEELVDWKKR